MKVTGLLASRAARTHRKAWAAVFAALALTSLLLGTFGLMLASAGAGHPRVERYAGTAFVVAGDQETRFTAKPWGSAPRTTRAGLTERVRVPWAALGVVRKVPGVRAAVADQVFRVGMAGRAALGRPWEAARPAPRVVRQGRAPRRAGEVVVGAVAVGDGTRGGGRVGAGAGARLGAGAGARLGARVALRVGGRDAAYTVVGVADGPSAAVYFTAGEARRLSGHPGAMDALEVLARPGADTGELAARVRRALDAAGVRSIGRRADGDAAALRVLTGNGRGGAEFLDAGPARTGLLELLGSVAATVVLIALLVVSSTVVQALRQRDRELGLLRAVGATPRQLRGAVGKEVGRVAGGAALAGAVGAFPGYAALRALLEAHGALPPGLELPLPPWLWPAPLITAGITVAVAHIAAVLACARTAKVRPAEALREARPGTARKVTGLVLLFVGVSSAGTAVLQRGAAAGAAAGAATVTMVSACALLGPWIAEGAMRVLGAPLRRFGGPGGYLAAANCRAEARRSGAALTIVILVVAFVCVQLSAGATLAREGAVQARGALRAGLAVRADGGLPAGAVERIRAVPGVRAATEVVRSTVVVARREAGEPRLDRLPVLGVTPQRLTRTLDPGVREGTVEELRPGTVAVGADRARSLDARPGSVVTLRFGDGAQARLRVVAIYERSLALGDFLFSRDELLRHLSLPGPGQVLVTAAPGGDHEAVARALTAAVSGARVERGAAASVRVEAPDQALGEVLTAAALSAIGGFIVIALLSTLSLIALGRRPELRLLRLAGAGRRQLRWMLRLEAAALAVTGLVVGAAVASVPLLAFSLAMAGTVPSLPLGQAVLVVAVVAVVTGAGTMLPLRVMLRGRYPGTGPSGW
ncbi:ABC transporter permease [Streptomyces lydicus]|uniref:ABC transporter permease n=1 Tax=Streptomyces lydicus TaxID=47763 RepID=UPI001013A4F5|nr:ABC transporter permease [Streptomyces lydicus]